MRVVMMVVMVWSIAALSLTAQQAWTCPTLPVEPCVKRHGRLSSQNGVALRLWLVGTKRVPQVANDIDTLPVEVEKYLEMTSEDHSYIFGDFNVCPLQPEVPGKMGLVCITAAEKLVVQPLRRSGSSFKIASTWPRRD